MRKCHLSFSTVSWFVRNIELSLHLKVEWPWVRSPLAVPGHPPPAGRVHSNLPRHTGFPLVLLRPQWERKGHCHPSELGWPLRRPVAHVPSRLSQWRGISRSVPTKLFKGSGDMAGWPTAGSLLSPSQADTSFLLPATSSQSFLFLKLTPGSVLF